MTIEHAVEIALIAIPTLIFVVLLRIYSVRKGGLASDSTGGILAYHSFEFITAAFLVISMLTLPELIAKVGEFRGMVAVLSARAAWSAFRTVCEELK